MQELKSPWTTKDTETLKALLARLPSPKPYAAFHALCGCMVTVAYELVVLRRNKEGLIEVLLTRRPDDDPDWPIHWHYPGSVIRPGDTSLDDVLARILAEEVQDRLKGRPGFVGPLLTHFERGPILQLIHLGVSDGEPQHGTFFNVEDLPLPFVEKQRPGLALALQAFKNLRLE